MGAFQVENREEGGTAARLREKKDYGTQRTRRAGSRRLGSKGPRPRRRRFSRSEEVLELMRKRTFFARIVTISFCGMINVMSFVS